MRTAMERPPRGCRALELEFAHLEDTKQVAEEVVLGLRAGRVDRRPRHPMWVFEFERAPGIHPKGRHEPDCMYATRLQAAGSTRSA